MSEKDSTSAITKAINGKVEIEFTTHGTSALVGNYWPTRKVKLNYQTAKRIVDAGAAKFVDGDDVAAPDVDANDDANADDDAGGDVVSLADALKTFDHSNDEQWTKGGLPDLALIQKLTGKEYTRAMIKAEIGDFERVKP